ncbi:putative RNA-binding protein [Zancudomyces culisetae]|uniref:Putative RNA-binding protein n=1 Tax=Zancudomyces culisetae TaxID=1213189 RepID=A0A1R1PLQ1_ZANCU|nr:putative RNA-binding protein [Zancudomyces culisetae]|eukprot:OMH81859.1 putative RNA-binding protein [Zancudomyces culisetae]
MTDDIYKIETEDSTSAPADFVEEYNPEDPDSQDLLKTSEYHAQGNQLDLLQGDDVESWGYKGEENDHDQANDDEKHSNGDQGHEDFNNLGESSRNVLDSESSLSGRNLQASSGKGYEKMFVGGLSWETTEDKLREYFGKYGEIDPKPAVPRDQQGQQYGQQQHLQQGYGRQGGGMMMGGGSGSGGEFTEGRGDTVFAGGLGAVVTEEDLREAFQSYGNIVEIKLMVDRATGRSKGFAFIQYEDEKSVQVVLSQGESGEGVVVKGKRVDVKNALHKKKTMNSNANMGMNMGMGMGGMSGMNMGMGMGGMNMGMADPMMAFSGYNPAAYGMNMTGMNMGYGMGMNMGMGMSGMNNMNMGMTMPGVMGYGLNYGLNYGLGSSSTATPSASGAATSATGAIDYQSALAYQQQPIQQQYSSTPTGESRDQTTASNNNNSAAYSPSSSSHPLDDSAAKYDDYSNGGNSSGSAKYKSRRDKRDYPSGSNPASNYSSYSSRPSNKRERSSERDRNHYHSASSSNPNQTQGSGGKYYNSSKRSYNKY